MHRSRTLSPGTLLLAGMLLAGATAWPLTARGEQAAPAPAIELSGGGEPAGEAGGASEGAVQGAATEREQSGHRLGFEVLSLKRGEAGATTTSTCRTAGRPPCRPISDAG